MQPKKYDDVKWQRVLLLKFKTDKSDRVNGIISNYYLPACTKSKTTVPSVLNVVAGEWDMIVTFDMKDGIEEMNWQTSPDNIAWLKAINEIAGSEAKAKAILDEFSSLVDHGVTYIGRLELAGARQ